MLYQLGLSLSMKTEMSNTDDFNKLKVTLFPLSGEVVDRKFGVYLEVCAIKSSGT